MQINYYRFSTYFFQYQTHWVFLSLNSSRKQTGDSEWLSFLTHHNHLTLYGYLFKTVNLMPDELVLLTEIQFFSIFCILGLYLVKAIKEFMAFITKGMNILYSQPKISLIFYVLLHKDILLRWQIFNHDIHRHYHCLMLATWVFLSDFHLKWS